MMNRVEGAQGAWERKQWEEGRPVAPQRMILAAYSAPSNGL